MKTPAATVRVTKNLEDGFLRKHGWWQGDNGLWYHADRGTSGWPMADAIRRQVEITPEEAPAWLR